MVIIAAVTVLVDVLRRPAARPRAPVRREIGWVIAALPGVLSVVLVLGTRSSPAAHPTPVMREQAASISAPRP